MHTTRSRTVVCVSFGTFDGNLSYYYASSYLVVAPNRSEKEMLWRNFFYAVVISNFQ